MYAFDAINGRKRGGQNWRKIFENFFLPAKSFPLRLYIFSSPETGGGELKSDRVPRTNAYTAS